MKKILVIQTASLGDVVLATSLLETIHDAMPSSSIDFLIKDGFQDVFIDHPFIHEVLVWNKKNNKYKNLLTLIKKIRKIKYDEVYNIQRFGSMAFLTVFSKAKFKAGFSSNLISVFYSHRVKHVIDGRHEIDRNAELLLPIYGSINASMPRLYPICQELLLSNSLVNDFIVLSPGSLWETKQWPSEKWVELCQKIPDKYSIVLSGTENERELCQMIIDNSGKQNAINLAGKLLLPSLISLTSKASFIFANDSALTHIASALNKPVATIFCSTVPMFGFTPLGSNAIVFEPEIDLKCRPCGIHGYNKCPKSHFNCGHFFSVNKIIELTLHL